MNVNTVVGYDFKCLRCGRICKRLEEGSFMLEPITVSIYKCKQCNHLYSMFSDHWLKCPKCGCNEAETWNHCCPKCNNKMESVTLYRDYVL